MIALLSLAMVVLVAFYLLGLGAASLVAPTQARRFLLGHASTPSLHWLEMGLRLLAGAAFVLRAPAMRFPEVFAGLGWVLLVTSAVLVLLPWSWHRRIAERSVPQALRFLPLLGVSALLLGGGLLWAALAPAH